MNILRFMIPKSLVEVISSDSTVRQAFEKMRFHRYTALPVLDGEGKYLGTVRGDDLFRYFFQNDIYSPKAAERDNVCKVTDSTYKPVYHSTSLDEVIERVKEHNFVPVVDDRGCFIGLILRRDILNFLLEYYHREEHAQSKDTDSSSR